MDLSILILICIFSLIFIISFIFGIIIRKEKLNIEKGLLVFIMILCLSLIIMLCFQQYEINKYKENINIIIDKYEENLNLFKHKIIELNNYNGYSEPDSI